MKIKNTQPQNHTRVMRKHAALALPHEFLHHLFASVIDLLINIPVMNAVWRERRELEKFSNHHNKDIGQSVYSVRQELNRSYFDIPQERKRSYRSVSTARYSKPATHPCATS